MRQKLVKLKKKLLMIVMINILLLQNLISLQQIFGSSLAQANLITKAGFGNNLISLNKAISLDKTNYLLVQNELKNLQTFDSIV